MSLFPAGRSALRLVSLICCLAASAAPAQPAAPGPFDLGGRFASVTITPHDESRFPGMFVDTEGNSVMYGTPLIAVISRAYGMREFQIVDGPEWIYTPNLYDIDAVPPPAELVESDDTRMLRSLLAERFKLELNASSREMTVQALEFVKTTPALHATQTSQFRVPTGAGEFMMVKMSNAAPGYRNIYMELTLSALARALTSELGANVVDSTGLTGSWTLELKDVPIRGPGIAFSSTLDQLGLRVAERTLPIDVLVITHVEHPALDD